MRSGFTFVAAGVISLLLSVQTFAADKPTATPDANEPKPELLWPNGAPGAKGDTDKDKPTIMIYPAPADKATGAGAIVVPGGGYGHIAMPHEGIAPAKWLNSLGVTAFVLTYRIAPRYQFPAPIDDGKRAVRTMRARAAEWKLDPKKIGIVGFSAGGHLSSSVGTHFDDGKSDNSDPIERVSCRPDFLVLAYPVISMDDKVTHKGSRVNLFGKTPDPKLVAEYSNENQVTANTPPTFLVATEEDIVVPCQNSALFFLALRNANVPAELHVYQKGKHGFGLAAADPVLSTWTDHAASWMRAHELIK